MAGPEALSFRGFQSSVNESLKDVRPGSSGTITKICLQRLREENPLSNPVELLGRVIAAGVNEAKEGSVDISQVRKIASAVYHTKLYREASHEVRKQIDRGLPWGDWIKAKLWDSFRDILANRYYYGPDADGVQNTLLKEALAIVGGKKEFPDDFKSRLKGRCSNIPKKALDRFVPRFESEWKRLDNEWISFQPFVITSDELETKASRIEWFEGKLRGIEWVEKKLGGITDPKKQKKFNDLIDATLAILSDREIIASDALPSNLEDLLKKRCGEYGIEEFMEQVQSAWDESVESWGQNVSPRRLAESAISDAEAERSERRYSDKALQVESGRLKKGFVEYLKEKNPDKEQLKKIVLAMADHTDNGWEALSRALRDIVSEKEELGESIKSAVQEVLNDVTAAASNPLGRVTKISELNFYLKNIASGSGNGSKFLRNL